MERPEGEVLEIETTETRESSSGTPSTTSRMIDLSIGLKLKAEDEKIVRRAFNKMLDHD